MFCVCKTISHHLWLRCQDLHLIYSNATISPQVALLPGCKKDICDLCDATGRFALLSPLFIHSSIFLEPFHILAKSVIKPSSPQALCLHPKVGG